MSMSQPFGPRRVEIKREVVAAAGPREPDEHRPRATVQGGPADPLRSEDPFRDRLHRLTFGNDAWRRAGASGDDTAADRALGPLADDMVFVLDSAISLLGATTASDASKVELVTEPVDDVVMSSLRSLIFSGELGEVVDLPAIDLHEALAEVLETGALRADLRDDALDSLRTLRATVREAERTRNPTLLDRVMPYVVRIAGLLSLHGVAGLLAAIVVGESLANEVMKAVVVTLTAFVAIEAKKILDRRREPLGRATRVGLAHRQLLRDIRELTASQTADRTTKAQARLQLVLDVAVLRTSTFDRAWPGKATYWEKLDHVQDWVENRRFRGGEEKLLSDLRAARPPRWRRVRRTR